MKRLSEKEISTISNEFYSNFSRINLADITSGIHFVCSEARDEELRGLGCKYSIYVLIKNDACVVTYSPRYADFFEKLKESSVNKILEALNQTFKMKRMQLMMFRRECVHKYGNAHILKKSDYPLYETFFRQTSPTANFSGWLQEYFEEKTEKEYFAGYFINGALVSVCDAPDMPYMSDIIQHTGIATLKEERKKGYAKCTAALATHHLIENGVCPQWECDIDNVASIALAESIGYVKYGVAYILKS